jgi:glycosyltransferase involved in cell wall biosynthesis
MRVLYVHSGNLYGGVETLLVTLARYRDLCPEMKPHYALCFEGRVSAELAAAGAPVRLLSAVRVSQPLTVLRARRKLGDLLRLERFDLAVCHSTWSQSLFGPVIKSNRLPLVFWLHNPTDGLHWLDRWGRRTVPDLVLCNSRFTANTLPCLYPGVRAEVVYCPIPPIERGASDSDRLATRAELQTRDDATVIIQISRMEKWKGHQLHLEALSRLKHLPDWICWQVGGAQRPGEARYHDQLRTLAVRLGIADRVLFLGQRTDVARLLAAADIHCQPNTSPEPFGLTFVEALASRLPVVTTRIGGAVEIVDESCGLLVSPDATALADALEQLIKDRALRKRLGDAGPARVRVLCDTESQMRHLHGCFSDLCRPTRERSKALDPRRITASRENLYQEEF